jgi:hypothetical protein
MREQFQLLAAENQTIAIITLFLPETQELSFLLYDKIGSNNLQRSTDTADALRVTGIKILKNGKNRAG